MIAKIITAIDVCTDNYYGYWKHNIYHAGIGDIGKPFPNTYKSVNDIVCDKERNREKMPIRKYYEVTCEVCSKVINHYSSYKPSLKQLRKDCGIVRINNGKIRIVCKDCVEAKSNKDKGD